MVKKMKAIHWLFVIFAIISVVIEYAIIYGLIFRKWWQSNDVLAGVLTGIIFIVCLKLMLISFHHDEVFDEDEDETLSPFHQAVIERMKARFRDTMGRDVDIIVANAYNQPAYMFAYLGRIIINTNQNYSYRRINNAHFEGVLAHEMGHIAHMPRVYHMALLRPSSMISNFMLNLCFTSSVIFKTKRANPFHYLSFALFYLLFIITSPINMLFFYPFKRFEESAADAMALKFSDGFSLRGYYYRTLRQMTKWDHLRLFLIDFNHPSPAKHYRYLQRAMPEANRHVELYSDQRIDVISPAQNTHQDAIRLEFYHHFVDKNLINMYIYIARLYEKQSAKDMAKQYYLKAGEQGKKSGYLNLIRLAKAEGKQTKLMPLYKRLADLGDQEALLIRHYYERWFIKTIKDNENNIVEAIPHQAILLTLDGRMLLSGFDSAYTLKIKRHKATVKAFDGINLRMTLTLEKDVISVLDKLNQDARKEPKAEIFRCIEVLDPSDKKRT